MSFMYADVMEVPLRILQEMGVHCICYLDDWLLWSISEQTAKEHGALLVEVLSGLGFVINFKKSVLTPTQSLEWLGVEWDTR